MMVRIALTEAAAAQAGADAEMILGQAYGELERRPWGEPTAFIFHVFEGAGGDYIMSPVSEDEIRVDVCLWDWLDPLPKGACD
jgi:hypothetical protein